METNSPFSNTEDRISKLPLPLIHHILSFIELHFAIKTSILSRRWRYIWNSLPTLNFDYDSFRRNNRRSDPRFETFVDMVLTLHDSSDLQRFHLNWYMNISARHVNTWILGALRRNVQDISVYINGDMSFQIPQCLFNCQSLTNLELHLGGTKKSKIVVPKSIDLPRLKSLKLVETLIEDVNIINKLISSCPDLESLVLSCSDIATDDLMNVNMDSVKIKHFELSNCRYLRSSGYSRAICIRLQAPNLTSFICKDCLSQDYSLEDLSSLVTAHIEMIEKESERYNFNEQEPGTYSNLSAEKKKVYPIRMMKFLEALYNVKELSLSPGILEVIARAPDVLGSQSPQFRNLQYLKLEMWHSRSCFRAITYLLNICPNIESLSLTRFEFYNSKEEEDDWGAELSQPCMLYHLKFLEFNGFYGYGNEFKLLEFLLKNGMVMEELVLYCCDSSDDRVKQMMQFNKKLKTFPRASSILTIYITDCVIYR